MNPEHPQPNQEVNDYDITSMKLVNGQQGVQLHHEKFQELDRFRCYQSFICFASKYLVFLTRFGLV
jgi:hypothetical protein